jgi:hypothetical protein
VNRQKYNKVEGNKTEQYKQKYNKVEGNKMEKYKKKLDEAPYSVLSLVEVEQLLKIHKNVGWVLGANPIHINWNLKNGFSVYNTVAKAIEVRTTNNNANQIMLPFNQISRINWEEYSGTLTFTLKNKQRISIVIY